MKPMILVPPAQAELLSDTQDELRAGDTPLRQPWRDDESFDERLAYAPRVEMSGPNAQLWPSSVNSSR